MTTPGRKGLVSGFACGEQDQAARSMGAPGPTNPGAGDPAGPTHCGPSQGRKSWGTPELPDRSPLQRAPQRAAAHRSPPWSYFKVPPGIREESPVGTSGQNWDVGMCSGGFGEVAALWACQGHLLALSLRRHCAHLRVQGRGGLGRVGAGWRAGVACMELGCGHKLEPAWVRMQLPIPATSGMQPQYLGRHQALSADHGLAHLSQLLGLPPTCPES